MSTLTSLDALGLEVLYLDRARAFYERHLQREARDIEDGHAVALDVGGTDLLLREPSTVPRGGLHVHYAMGAPFERYDAWYDALSESFDLEEVTFGDATSLYFFDPDGHCVEIGQRDVSDETDGLTGVFEVVLEVEDLERAEDFYRALGFEPVDRGDERPRIRLDGPMSLELWEPHRGLADARGGVHADLRFSGTPLDAIEAVGERALDVEVREDSNAVRIRDPDGHYLTVERE
ncbi:VOC family protein [Halospeciosus flavus]|uniref:VOC family protein n=1 Tax=Halospeciosus flavus TaxID=3032283 RepID=A0ABD5Z3P1_9EURY|nr:VOC family protein [Halospeciosus flavus]